MCGITGIWRRDGAAPTDLEHLVRAQADTLRHRGPDDGGTWTDRAAGIGLGHRRLAIVDLSPAGHQPMVSHSGRWVVAFNGEIYNHAVLRRALEANATISWRGTSDTEVLLAGIDAWGVRATVARCVGMFAVALWDREERVLWLVRDRLGIKPLYVAKTADGLAFASELKAIRRLATFDHAIDHHAVSDYLRRGYVASPGTIYRNAWKIPAGTIARVGAPRLSAIHEDVYWSPDAVADAGERNPSRGGAEESVEALDRLLRDAVKLRMIADVPLGALLSGGVDSSTVVALMQQQSDRPVKTFSIGNEQRKFDESSSARAVAMHLGTDHTELVVRARDALDVIPLLPAMYDEPFGDSSQIPTYLVSKLARGHVTVALSGDGGDELFGGYERHLWVGRLRALHRTTPEVARKVLAAVTRTLSAERWDQLLGTPFRSRVELAGRKAHKLADVLAVANENELFDALGAIWQSPPVAGWTAPRAGTPSAARLADVRGRMMLDDLRTYLTDDILVKVDRASMAVALEARVPLLDHRVVEYALQLPMERKIHRGRTKWVLRRVLSRYVPDALVERPKMGFGVPIGDWLRGPLRAWAEDLLEPTRLRQEGLLDGQRVRHAWEQHVAGRGAHEYRLWAVLMFQAWLETTRG